MKTNDIENAKTQMQKGEGDKNAKMKKHNSRQ
jgi:hypothetical protein